MAVSIAFVNTAIENFLSWVNKTNLLINCVSNTAVTTDFTANGGLTTGNAYVNGIFAAVTLCCTTLQGGNVQSGGGILNITANTITLGNSTVNTFANSTLVNSSVLQTGNTTVGFMANTSGFRLNGTFYSVIPQKVTVANGSVNVSTEATLNLISGNNISIGIVDDAANNSADVTITCVIPANLTFNTITLGNSTVNATINSTVIAINAISANYSTLATQLTVGNSTVNTVANSSQFTVTRVSVGNSTVNLAINSTSITLAGTTYTNLTPYVLVANSGSLIGSGQPEINFQSGTDIVITVVNNVAQNRYDVLCAANIAAIANGSVGGANTQVQFNDSGTFNALAAFTFDKTTSIVTVANSVNALAINANNMNYTYSVTNTFSFTTSNLSTITLDSFNILAYRSVEYMLSMTDNNANNYQCSTIMLLQDGTNAYISEYATLISNTTIATFTPSANTTAIILQFTPNTSNNVTIKAFRKLIAI